MSNLRHAGPQPTNTTVSMAAALSIAGSVISILEKRIIVIWKTG
jgi:hypothetical protein